MAGDTILVPLDGSEFAEAALHYAKALGKATGRQLSLLSVVGADIRSILPHRQLLGAMIVRAEEAQARRHLHRHAAELRSAGLEVETDTAVGLPAEEILKAARSADVSLIVMATHGRSGINRALLGSVADKVMRLAPCPVLLVRPPHAGQASEALQLQHLLVPLDGSHLAEAALEPASELALATGASLTLVRVVPHLSSLMDWGSKYVPELDEVEAEMATEARQFLEAARSRLPDDVHVETVVLRGSPALALEGYGKSHAIDLTIMTTHGCGGLSRLLLGSVAEQLVHAGIPLLLVHAVGDGSARQCGGEVAVREPAHSG